MIPKAKVLEKHHNSPDINLFLANAPHFVPQKTKDIFRCFQGVQNGNMTRNGLIQVVFVTAIKLPRMINNQTESIITIMRMYGRKFQFHKNQVL